MDLPSPSDSSPTKPEEGASIARTGVEETVLRKRIERPARIGRFALTLLGAVTAGAGVAAWITNGKLVDLALASFGGVLFTLGLVQHLLYQRDKAHWPDQVLLWEDGLELTLHNGEVRGASWSDPDLALHLVARRVPPPAKREYLLIWLMDSKIPPAELSAEGFDKLRKVAVNRGLQMSQNQRGARADATQLIDIRQSSAVTAAGLAKAAEASGPG